MEAWGFFNLLALYLLAHMELSLHLSFYLRHSLRGHTMGTTMGFAIQIVEALAP
jgi:hypothetical protein